MRVVAIIAEYNPLHNGHEYQIRMAKEKLSADHVIVLMTGNYNQRGMPAIVSKRIRSSFAINAGADLVLELPACFSIEDVPSFSFAAVSIINNLGVADNILFSSESGSISNLYEMANIIRSSEYEQLTKKHSDIISPSQRRVTILKEMGEDRYIEEINKPNNLLGIHFILGLWKIRSKIEPVTIKRIGSDYFDVDSKCSIDGRCYSSATKIRDLLLCTKLEDGYPDSVFQHVPTYVNAGLKRVWHIESPIERSDFWEVIKSLVSQKNITEIKEISGVNNEIANLIKKIVLTASSYDECIAEMRKSNSDYNYHRILFRIIVNSKKTYIKEYSERQFDCLINILAHNTRAEELIKSISLYGKVKLISGPYSGEDPFYLRQYNEQKKADILYSDVVKTKFV